jgi:hypothetical protein
VLAGTGVLRTGSILENSGGNSPSADIRIKIRACP